MVEKIRFALEKPALGYSKLQLVLVYYHKSLFKWTTGSLKVFEYASTLCKDVSAKWILFNMTFMNCWNLDGCSSTETGPLQLVGASASDEFGVLRTTFTHTDFLITGRMV